VHTDPLTGLEAAVRGLYLHFPYCLRRCPYCDFAIRIQHDIPHARYASVALRELELRLAEAPEWEGRTLDSLYVGGGTPSLWEPEQLGRVLDGIRRRLPLAPEAEVSLEANPEVSDRTRLAAFRALGVNRLSIGLQSFEAATLRTLGRAHAPEDGARAVEAARSAGFDNVSVDLIIGVPGQTVAAAVEDARRVASLGPDHVSAYVLTVERQHLGAETAFSKQVQAGTLRLPEDSTVVEMVDGATAALAGAGLARYEISSYARPGKHSRHNALYWTGGESLALGVGAVGFRRTGTDRGLRTTALRSTPKWMEAVESGVLPDAEREELGRAELYAERLLLGLRLRNGLDLSALWASSGAPPRKAVVEALIRDGFLEPFEGRVRLTDHGAHLHTEISARLL
jgi:putative oxygen-independent coproporphyrinogen III oxidase